MDQIRSAWLGFLSLMSGLFLHPDWRNIIDIVIMSIVIYYIIKLLLRTRASAVFKGVGILLAVSWLAELFQLSTVSWTLQQVINTGVIVLVILFQSELRRGLEQIGRTRFRKSSMLAPGRRNTSDQAIQSMVQAMNNMARKRIGALIVIECSTGLNEFIESGTTVDGEISAPLIENIFEPNTPLHDGAMIIRDQRIIAAACILQLTEDKTVSRELGTRHRAAIGISETTDAVALIVSEETGIISMAREGKLTRYLDTNSLTAVLTKLFKPDENVSSIFSMFRKKEGGGNEGVE